MVVVTSLNSQPASSLSLMKLLLQQWNFTGVSNMVFALGCVVIVIVLGLILALAIGDL